MAGLLNSVTSAVSGWTAMPTISAGTGSSITANGVIKAKAFIEVNPDVPAIEIDHPAMQADLKTLQTVWVTAFQNKWVYSDELSGFHWISAQRLCNARRMEKMYLADQDKAVYKIIED